MDGSNKKSYGMIASISDLQPYSEVTIEIQDADLCIYTDNVATDIQAVVEQLWLCVGQLGLDNWGWTTVVVQTCMWKFQIE